MKVRMERTQRAMRYTLENGTSIISDGNFEYKGRQYAFFGNVWYDLDEDLVNYIFGR
jgi:hypothetical protein